MNPAIRYRFFTTLAALITLSIPAVAGDDPVTKTAHGAHGMVSSAHPLATQAGLDILENGGNAFDAAVAIAATLNVVEPMNSGIGGYGTILIYDAERKRTRFLNCSGRIPRSVNADVFRSATPGYLENRRGAKAVSTPGNVNAWKALSKNYGRLEWKTLFSRAVRLADEGFAINPALADALKQAFDEFPENAKVIYGRDGKPLRAGETLVQQDLARVLRTVAEFGARTMRGGDMARAIDRAMREAGGFLTLADLKSNRAEWFDPIEIDYRGCTVATASPPATAFPSLIRLGLMSRFDVAALGHNSPEFLHRFCEVTKHAFWCRLRYAGSPEHNPPPLERLLSEAYWSEHAGKIDLVHASTFAPPTSFAADSPNTTHFVVADRWGNVVSATQTLGNHFGSRIMPEGMGVWLNNSLAYCTFEPAGNPMDALAGRHKLSGDCPTILFKNGEPWAAIGTPGGHTIGQVVPQIVMNLVDFKMDIAQALAAGRVSFVQPDKIAVEAALDADVRAKLKAMGHRLQTVPALGNAHGLVIERDEHGAIIGFRGAADPRGFGLAKGF